MAYWYICDSHAYKPNLNANISREIRSGKSSQQTGIKETRTRHKETTNK